MGKDGNVLRGPIDRSDLINCLEGLGYTRINEISFGNNRFGTIPDFENALIRQTLGVPTCAAVEVNQVGNEGNFFYLKFTY